MADPEQRLGVREKIPLGDRGVREHIGIEIQDMGEILQLRGDTVDIPEPEQGGKRPAHRFHRHRPDVVTPEKTLGIGVIREQEECFRRFRQEELLARRMKRRKILDIFADPDEDDGDPVTGLPVETQSG
ncbi:MAG TPA: hypothetical protein PLP29_17445 [Candidatus Ozemobacteraceae bacterium]|nr:hypothetical protein [Candidatus Ozemobacteraceae bacterium]